MNLQAERSVNGFAQPGGTDGPGHVRPGLLVDVTRRGSKKLRRPGPDPDPTPYIAPPHTLDPGERGDES